MNFKRVAAFTVAIVALALGSSFAARAQDDNWVVKTGQLSVAETVDKLTNAIEMTGGKVAAVIDHAAAAEKAGMDLAPTTLVIFGNPKIGTPLMQENQQIGIDLPMRVLVWQDGNDTKVGYIKPEMLASWYGISADAPSIQTMIGALTKLTDGAIAP
jgi:uncharacterized protein (DUF302 family)